MATISCHCGKVCIQFSTTTPRATQECCCHDCFHRLDYLSKLGGPSMPKAIQDRMQPTTFHYFVNRMTIVSGKEYLRFFLLQGGDNHNMATTCCHTFLTGHSLKYSGNCVAVPVELNTLKYPNGTGVVKALPLLRWFPAHLVSGGTTNDDDRMNPNNEKKNEDAIQQTTPDPSATTTAIAAAVPTAWFGEGGTPTGSDGWESNFAQVCEAWMRPVSELENVGETFADILKEYKNNGGIVPLVSQES